MEPGTKEWEQIKGLFDTALKYAPGEREQFLSECCPDEKLRAEVLSLLRNDESARILLPSDLREDFVATRTSHPAFSTKTRLGPYEITDFLGAGGMGEVYRARDTRLNRSVAIKVMPEASASEPDLLRRFEQEARAVAALNHPNVLAIYDIGLHNRTPYIVSELLEGSTLRQQLASSALSLRKSVDYGVQIARALSTAHAKGIVHRDLKPENLFVTKDGQVKVLDFGLAKLIRPRQVSGDISRTDDIGTEPGVVMGTVGYMSPEQVRGHAADHRCDIFAFGAILYEMLMGKRAFQKPTSAETMSAILNEEPSPFSQTPNNLPPALQRVVQRCLEKNPEQRFQSASDLAFALESLSDSGSASSPAIPRAWHIRWQWIVAGTIAILTIGGVVTWFLIPLPQPRVTGSTQLTNGSNRANHLPALNWIDFRSFVIVTDGPRLYFNDLRQSGAVLAQMSAKGGDVSVIPTTIDMAVLSDISPDHSQLLIGSIPPHYAAIGSTPIWTLPLPSGSAQKIGDLEANWAAWSSDGKQLVFTKGHDLYLANGDGSGRRSLASQPEGFPGLAYFSPDGTRVRFTLRGSTDTLWEVRVDGKNLHQLFPGWHNPPDECCGRWTPDGRYYVFQSSVRNSTGTDVLASDIFALAESRGVLHKNSNKPMQLTFGPTKFAYPVVSADEKKMFLYGWQSRGELVRYDNHSHEFVPLLGGISATSASFSHDGKWVAYISIPDGFLWRSRVDGSERLQLTSGPNVSWMPKWSPDGTSIAFMSSHDGRPWKIYLIAADGGSPKLLVPTSSSGDPTWSPDGGQLAFGTGDYGSENETIGIVDVKSGNVSTIPRSEGMSSPLWSPDGRYLAALLSDSGPGGLMLYNFESQSWKSWTTDAAGVWYPSWTSDSQYVQYGSNPSPSYSANVAGPTFKGSPEIRRVKLGESRPETVSSLKEFHIYTGLMGPWMSTAPDNSVMLVRDTSSMEIYALDVEFP